MNICIRHEKYPINANNKNNFNKVNEENEKLTITNKYFLCKFCGVLIDENDEVNFI